MTAVATIIDHADDDDAAAIAVDHKRLLDLGLDLDLCVRLVEFVQKIGHCQYWALAFFEHYDSLRLCIRRLLCQRQQVSILSANTDSRHDLVKMAVSLFEHMGGHFSVNRYRSHALVVHSQLV